MSNRSARRSARPSPLNAALHAAICAHQAGDLADAERRYRAVLRAAPHNPDALHYLGVARHQQGDPAEALRLIGCALELAPNYVDARNNLGNVQKESGLYGEAERSYRAVLAERPDFVMALNNLGVVLKEQGRHADAIASYRRAVALAPQFAQGWLNLGHALKQSGERAEALSAYYEAVMLQTANTEAYRNMGHTLVAFGQHDKALKVYELWRKVEPDNPAVEHLIAACHGAAAPERASDSYVQHTFDHFADSFDDVLDKLEYRAPLLCGELLADLLGRPEQRLDVLDAGCGTGLCAPWLKPYARRLVGVDLSPGMLAKAAQRNVYDALDAAEVTAWLAAADAGYDLIVSADTLCYFGALEAVMAAAGGALRPGGTLIFTVEATADSAAAPTFLLHPHGRYSHTEAYVREALATAGLDVMRLRHVTLRTEVDLPVAGLLVGARRPA
ncbi:tetratricopeptide repeat protein [Duganella callida]|uniref:Tetratricopeptide repeat protein n=1 Tax=Duganella callida TaxID=2561932 RepID=A0A4Y9S019_9BURK|nr:tetratricopeptide repeat protein [Duganella callida]TFW14837.1 tetratricopeptide repeat protein [Duganella callida]